MFVTYHIYQSLLQRNILSKVKKEEEGHRV